MDKDSSRSLFNLFIFVALMAGLVYLVGPLFLVMILIIIIAHEFGHWGAYKMYGVTCKVLSFGFGPKIVSYKYKGTDYRLSMLPLGGYVQSDIESVKRMTLMQRCFASFAGPLVNILLYVGTSIAILATNDWNTSSLYVKSFWTMFAYINLVIVYLNLIPIDFFDGGHIFDLLWSKFTGSKTKSQAHSTVKTGILIFMIVVYYFYSLNIRPV